MPVPSHLVPRTLLALGMLSLLGCELTEDVGELPMRPSDAGAALDADPLAAPLFPEAGGSLDHYERLLALLTADTWWGVTSYAEQVSEPYEVVFDPDGTYRTRCLFASRCEPFGVGSDGTSRHHRWLLSTLNAGGQGRGELWSRAFGLSYGMELDELRYRERDDSLSFVLRGVPVTESALDVTLRAKVLLSRGPRPAAPPSGLDGGVDGAASGGDAGADAEVSP